LAPQQLTAVGPPGFHHGVDVEHPHLAAEPQNVERGHVDAEIDAEARSGFEDRAQHLAVVRGRKCHLMVVDAALGEEGVVRQLGLDDVDLLRVVLEVPLDERKGAPPDRAEADHHDGSVDASVAGELRHQVPPSSGRDGVPSKTARLARRSRKGKRNPPLTPRV
jgi:hypothetical protein